MRKYNILLIISVLCFIIGFLTELLFFLVSVVSLGFGGIFLTIWIEEIIRNMLFDEIKKDKKNLEKKEDEEDKEKEEKKDENHSKPVDSLNVKDWIQISGFLIAAQLTIIALVWQEKPNSGIFSVTVLLMLSFAFFINSIFANSKVHNLIKDIASFEKLNEKLSKKITEDNEKEIKKNESKIKLNESIISKVVEFGHSTFNFGYTFSILGFTVLAYKYMIEFIDKHLIVIFLPIIFMSTIWVLLIFYTKSKSLNRDDFLEEIKESHKITSFIIEAICLTAIIFDYIAIRIGFIIIP